jgi:hypothetical protein
MQIIETYLKNSNPSVDYFHLTPKQKTRIFNNTQTNLDYLKRSKESVGYTFDEERIWKGVLPKRSPQSPIGAGQNNPHQFVSELTQSKSFGDLSGKQIAALNHINEVLACEELHDKLPKDTVIIVDSSDNYQVEYKMQGMKKVPLKNVKHYTKPNIFSQHFTFTGGR